MIIVKHFNEGDLVAIIKHPESCGRHHANCTITGGPYKYKCLTTCGHHSIYLATCSGNGYCEWFTDDEIEHWVKHI